MVSRAGRVSICAKSSAALASALFSAARAREDSASATSARAVRSFSARSRRLISSTAAANAASPSYFDADIDSAASMRARASLASCSDDWRAPRRRLTSADQTVSGHRLSVDDVARIAFTVSLSRRTSAQRSFSRADDDCISSFAASSLTLILLTSSVAESATLW